MQHITHFIQPLLDLLFPVQCAACPQTGAILCASCQAAIQPVPEPACTHCHTPLTLYAPCRPCALHPLQLDGLRSVSTYWGPLRTCIHAFKYQGLTRLAEPLGSLLATTWQRTQISVDLIIPIPLHNERLQRRGYNHAALLARVCARILRLPCAENVVQRTRPTRAQAQLTMEKRSQNVAGAFACHHTGKKIIRGKRVLLLDDVCTTGATLEACAQPLFEAGAQRIWGLVLARPLSSG